jgi:hypothetical protein
MFTSSESAMCSFSLGLDVPIPTLPVTVRSALEPDIVNDPVISASPL